MSNRHNLGFFKLRMRTRTKSGQPTRYGYTTDSGWSGTNGAVLTYPFSAENDKMFFNTSVTVKQWYVHYYNNKWELVISLQGNVKAPHDSGWTTIINCKRNRHVIRRERSSFTRNTTTRIATWKWRGSVEIQDMRATLDAYFNEYSSGQTVKYMFTSDEPSRTNHRVNRIDFGTFGSDPSEKVHGNVPAVWDEHSIIELGSRVTDCKIRTTNSSEYQQPDDPNLGPHNTIPTRVRPFYSIGTAIGGGSNSQYNYLIFNDWLWGDDRPTGAMGYNPATDHIKSSQWGGMEIRANDLYDNGCDGWFYRGTVAYGYYNDNSGGNSPTFTIYYTPNSDSPNPDRLVNLEYMIEWPDAFAGNPIHNQRVNTQSSTQRYLTTRQTFGTAPNYSYYIESYRTGNRHMFLMQDTTASTSGYPFSISYKYPSLKETTTGGVTRGEVQVTGMNGPASSHTLGNSSTSIPTEDEFFTLEKNLAPFGQPIELIIKNLANEDDIEVATTTEGVYVQGDNPETALATSGMGSAGAGRSYHLVEAAGGDERYRFQTTFTYSNGKRKVYTLKGKIIGASITKTALFQNLQHNVTKTVGIVNINLVGSDGVRFNFEIDTGLTTSGVNNNRGLIKTIESASVSGGTLFNTTGPLKSGTSGNKLFYDNLIFVPNLSSSTWSVQATVKFRSGGDSGNLYKCKIHAQGTWKPDYSVEVLNPKGGTRLDHNSLPIRWVASGSGTVSNSGGASNQTEYDPGPGTTEKAFSLNNYSWQQASYHGGSVLLSIYWAGTRVRTQVENNHSNFATSYYASGWTYHRGSFEQGSSGAQHYHTRRTRTITVYNDNYADTFINIPESFSASDEDDYVVINNIAESKVEVDVDSGVDKVKMVSSMDDHWDDTYGPLDLDDTYQMTILKIGGF